MGVKYALVFSGQGNTCSQNYKELFHKYREEVSIANEILGYSIEEFADSKNGIHFSNTKFMQPMLYVLNALAFKELKATGDYFFVGHSLGEFNALQAAGAISFEDGLKLVQVRGDVMSKVPDGCMCAVCGEAFEKIINAINDCNKNIEFDIANYNSPKQIVISGISGKIAEAKENLESQGLRCIPLHVSGAFHSQYMKQPNSEFVKVLNTILFHELKGRVVSSATGKEYTNTNIKEILTVQMYSPVKWIESINYIINEGVYSFYQVGDQRHLIKLIDEIKFSRAVAANRGNRQ